MFIERLSEPARRLVRQLIIPNARESQTSDAAPREFRRYLSDRPQAAGEYLQAAEDYVGNLSRQGTDYLYFKPYDNRPGNETFFGEFYQVLNILRAMDLPGGARVLEVGCGPGWVTEILALMGFQVDALDPSQSMIEIARERLEACRMHHRLNGELPVQFHCCALEECELPDDAFDGVLFHESLHHVVDERDGLRQVFRMLRPGGIMGVSGESLWEPGNRVLERSLEVEMEQYGTLENPFTCEYLDRLLRECGFDKVTRYEGVNGLFPVAERDRPLREVAMFPSTSLHNLTACKPDRMAVPTTLNDNVKARGEITVLNSEYDPIRRALAVRVELYNNGDSAWRYSDRSGRGFVTLALRQGPLKAEKYREAPPRARLRQNVMPGERITNDPRMAIPDAPNRRAYRLDGV